MTLFNENYEETSLKEFTGEMSKNSREWPSANDASETQESTEKQLCKNGEVCQEKSPVHSSDDTLASKSLNESSIASTCTKPDIEGGIHEPECNVIKITTEDYDDPEEVLDRRSCDDNSGRESLYDEARQRSSANKAPNHTGHTYHTFDSVRHLQQGDLGSEDDYDVTVGTSKVPTRSKFSAYSSFEHVRHLLDSEEDENENDNSDEYNTLGWDGKRPENRNYDHVSLDGICSHSASVVKREEPENQQRNKTHMDASAKRKLFRDAKQSSREKSNSEITALDDCRNPESFPNGKDDRVNHEANIVNCNDNSLFQEDDYTFCEIDDNDILPVETNDAIYEECVVNDEEENAGNSNDNNIAKHGNVKGVDDTHDGDSEVLYEDVSDEDDDDLTASTNVDLKDKETDCKNGSSGSENTIPEETCMKKSIERRKHDYEEYLLEQN